MQSTSNAMAAAKAIARAAEAAALATKRAADAMSEALAGEPPSEDRTTPGGAGTKRGAPAFRVPTQPRAGKRKQGPATGTARGRSSTAGARLPLRGSGDREGGGGTEDEPGEFDEEMEAGSGSVNADSGNDEESEDDAEEEGHVHRKPAAAPEAGPAEVKAAAFPAVAPAPPAKPLGPSPSPAPKLAEPAGPPKKAAAVPPKAEIAVKGSSAAAVPPKADIAAKSSALAAFSVPVASAPKAEAAAKAARGSALTFAGRYPPKDPVRRARFLRERQAWHDWRDNLRVYSAVDSQASFWNFMREKVDLGADNYDDTVEDYIRLWQRNSHGSW